MVREGRSIAAFILNSHGVQLDAFERELEAHLPPAAESRVPTHERSWTLNDERILELATVEARELGNEFFSCEHVLLSFLRDPTGVTAQLLAQHGLRYDDARAAVLRVYNARPED